MRQKSGMFWHIHHNRLVEWSDNIDERIDYIKEKKPANEIETRLRLMKRVKGKLPKEFVKAEKARSKAWHKADKAWEKRYETFERACKSYIYWKPDAWEKTYETLERACNAWEKAQDKADNAWNKHRAEIEALHKIECPNCTWDGEKVKL